MKDQKTVIVESALNIAEQTGSARIFLFLNAAQDMRWFFKDVFCEDNNIVLVLPRSLEPRLAGLRHDSKEIIWSWSGNQSRFSRIKYAFLQGVLQGIITTESKVVCVLGPWGKSHLDTITIHDLGLSWSEEFPFYPDSLVKSGSFETIISVVDIALDIGALGREGQSVGTSFIIGDTDNVLKNSHQAVFNPFKGYAKAERMITRSDVVESIKELAKLDGAFVITENGLVEAAGRHLDARSLMSRKFRGMGSRHRAGAGITKMTHAVAVVVSESTGRVTVFEKGRIIASLEPVISRRLV